MNWAQVGTIAASFAPTLGGILGGLIPFPGGALIGQQLGNIIAKQFGVPATPGAVAAALGANERDVVIAKLNAAVEQAKVEIDGFARIYEAEAKLIGQTNETVNVTMRTELEHQHWFFTGWRPACGWVFVFFAILFGLLLCYATVLAIKGDDKPLKVITDAWPAYLAFFGTLAAMVGVYIVGRSQEKVARATPPTPPVIVKAKGK